MFMKELSDIQIKNINGGLGFAKLLASMTVGAVTGALRGVAGGPAAMVGGAILGAGMGAAGVAIHDAAEIAEKNKAAEQRQ